MSTKPCYEVEIYRDGPHAIPSMTLTEGGNVHAYFLTPVFVVWLAQGAVSYMGGKLLSSIMHDPSISDVEGMIRNAIAEINAYTRRVIEENEIRKLVAQMDSITRNLRQYANATTIPDMQANKYLLTDAILKTSEAMSACMTLGIAASFCYANAVSLRLLALSAFFTLEKSPASRTAAIESVDEGKKALESLFPAFEKSWEPDTRIQIPNPPCRWIPDERQPYGSCWLVIDGTQTEVHSGLALDSGEWNDIVQEFRNNFAQQKANAISAVEPPLRAAEAEWDKAIAKLRAI